MRNDIIAVMVDGEVQVHFKDRTGNYATLCGLDGDDPHDAVRQAAAKLPKNAKVNCSECINTFYFVRRLSASDIAAEHRVYQTARRLRKNN